MVDVGIINECMIAECPWNFDGECRTCTDITPRGMCEVYEKWAETGEWPKREPLPKLECPWCLYQEFGPEGKLPKSKRCPKYISWWDGTKTQKHPCKGIMVRQKGDSDGIL